MRLLVPIVCLIACGAGSGDSAAPTEGPCALGPDPTVDAGHGELRFMEFEDGPATPVELIHGPQGGYHSTIAVRAQHMKPDHAYVINLVGTIDGVELGGGTPLSEFRCNHRVEAQEFTGGLLIWDAEPEELHAKRATVNIHVIDPEQQTQSGQPVIVAMDTAEFTIWDPALEN